MLVPLRACVCVRACLITFVHVHASERVCVCVFCVCARVRVVAQHILLPLAVVICVMQHLVVVVVFF